MNLSAVKPHFKTRQRLIDDYERDLKDNEYQRIVALLCHYFLSDINNSSGCGDKRGTGGNQSGLLDEE